MARVAINTGSIANDGTGDTLRAAGGIINSNFSDIYNYFGDGTNLNFSGGNWEVTAVGINTLSSVGIGTTNPRFALEVGAVGASGTSLWVNGNARVTGILTVGTASIVLDGALNTISVGSGVTINGDTGIIDATSIVVGGTTITGAGVTRIEAGSGISVDQNTGQVTITATGGGGESYWSQNATGINTTSNVGIGTTTASSALTVKGNTSLESLNVSGISTFSGNVQTNGSNIKLGDGTEGTGNQIKLGNGSSPDSFGDTSDFWIYHNPSYGNLFQDITGAGVEVWTAEFKVANPSNPSENVFYTIMNAGTELYYNRNKKFETLGAGVTVTGTTFTNQLSVSGVSTFSGDIKFSGTYGDNGALWDESEGALIFKDGREIRFGDYDGSGGDLRIYHDAGGSHSYIQDTGTGNLRIISNGDTIELLKGTSETMAKFNTDESVELYYDNSKKFETLGAGVTVTGTTFTNQLSVSGVSTFSGDIKFSGTYGDNGALWDESEGALIFKDGREIRFGDYDGSGGDLRIYHDAGGSHSYIQDTGTGNLRIISNGDAIELLKDITETMAKFNTDGSVELYYDNSKKFETTTNGVSISGIITATSGIVTYYGDTSNAADGRWTLGANGTSDYTFTGIGFTQTTNDPVLYLARGRVYEFVNNSGGAHPFEIRVSNGGAAYSDGVTNNAAATGVIRFEIPFNAPNTLYYQCTVHSGMGNTISVYPNTI